MGAAAGLTFDSVQEVEWGLSSRLALLSHGCVPLALYKENRGFLTRARAELAALTHLSHAGFEQVPHVLATWESVPSTPPGAMLLQWVEASIPPGPHAISDWESVGRFVASLHEVDASDSGMKLSDDPLSLSKRLITQATQTMKRCSDELRGRLNPAFIELTRELEAEWEWEMRVVHRDLRPPNLLQDRESAFCGLVDFEHAAATDPAWDFAKIRMWLCATPATYNAFMHGYANVRSAPPSDKIRIFSFHEALTMAAYFESKNPEYVKDALSVLSRYEVP